MILSCEFIIKADNISIVTNEMNETIMQQYQGEHAKK